MASGLDSAWPEIEKEISEDTRCGNLKHWAYTDKAAEKKTAATTERTRREVAIASATAATTLESERGDVRTVLQRKRVAAVLDSDFDDGRHGKRNGSNNKRTNPAEFTAATIPGLGITTTANTHKRRRIEKPPIPGATAGHPMEKSFSGTHISNARAVQANPREPPVVEPRKRNRGGGGTVATVNRRR